MSAAHAVARRTGILQGLRKLSDRIERENELIDLNKYLAAFVYFVMAIIGIAAVCLSYPAKHSYWKMIYGDRGVYVESALMLFGSLFIYWIRQVLFPRTAPGRNTTTTRNQYAFQGAMAVLLFAALPYYCAVFMGSQYRYTLPSKLYILWLIPIFFYIAWAFEVAVAVYQSYSPKQLRESILDTGDVQDLYERMKWDTQDLVWGLGTIAFFFLICFADFYLSLTWVISVVIIAITMFVSIWPWRNASRHASGLLYTTLDELEKQRSDCYDRLVAAPFRSVKWKAVKSELDDILSEIKLHTDKLEQFDIILWLEQRRKDVLPLALLNLAAAFWRLPALDQLLNILKR